VTARHVGESMHSQTIARDLTDAVTARHVGDSMHSRTIA